MRISRSLALPCLFLGFAAAVACTQKQASSLGGYPDNGDDTSGDSSQTEPGKSSAPKSGDGGASKPLNDTCIGKAGFTFDEGGECDTCMSDQDGCCQKLVACFKDDPQCAELQKCVDDCSGTGGGGGGDGGATNQGQTVFVNEVYPSVNPTCGSCHAAGTGGAPIYFGADALSTYTKFKQNNLQNGSFLNKGPHSGPALTTAQQDLVKKWMAAEGVKIPGSGGGGGTGGGDGGADGGALTGKACKDACKTKYAASLPKWDAYQACITTTCKTQCQ